MKGIYRWVFAILVLLTFLPSTPAKAHPELIFYIDTSATVHRSGSQLYLDYYIAKSEQFAFAELAKFDSDLSKYSREECSKAVGNFNLMSGKFDIDFELQSASAIERMPGTGAGVWVWCRYLSPVEFYDRVDFSWEDRNFLEAPGYREFNIGLGTSKSIDLTNYELVLDLWREVSAEFALEFPIEVKESMTEQEPLGDTKEPDAEPTPEPSVITEPVKPKVVTEKPIEQSWITELSDRYFRSINPTPITVIIGTILALLLGALHSIAPGHGKSIMAVLALAERGHRREIYRLGLTMGATHTFGVFVLGTLLIAGSTFVPRSIIPTLGIISGGLIVVIGLFYVFNFIKHERSHRDGEHHHHRDESVSGGRIALLGVVGGMVPTPTALTVMVGTAALGSPWYGVLLVISYGVGMTSVLIFAGRVLERAYRVIEGLAESKDGAARLIKFAPAGAATLQVIAGCFLVLLSYGALI